MNDCDLGIYYDNPNEASDMYLKWLLKDCEENNIQVRVFDNLSTFWKESSNFKASLFLEPIQDTHAKILRDCINNNVDKPSATAQGIYNYITDKFPRRESVIVVIGRGLVGRQLLDMLINYGYTVIEFNSKTDKYAVREMLFFADAVVGLANQENVLDAELCSQLNDYGITLIDSGNNFATKNKLRCGKWTRQVIIDRIKKLKGEEV
jgi:5,10-methylene-tetrahydrofolate dehydrogenase/methenyl tetrahydrofolate cyclohydrolase